MKLSLKYSICWVGDWADALFSLFSFFSSFRDDSLIRHGFALVSDDIQFTLNILPQLT